MTIFLPTRYNLTGIVTRGDESGALWVSTLKLEYSEEGVLWLGHFYESGNEIVSMVASTWKD